jgi:hypothetical protein
MLWVTKVSLLAATSRRVSGKTLHRKNMVHYWMLQSSWMNERPLDIDSHARVVTQKMPDWCDFNEATKSTRRILCKRLIHAFVCNETIINIGILILTKLKPWELCSVTCRSQSCRSLSPTERWGRTRICGQSYWLTHRAFLLTFCARGSLIAIKMLAYTSDV